MSEFLDRKATVKVFSQDISYDGEAGGVRVTNVAQEGFAYSSILPDGSPGFRIRFSVLVNSVKTMNPSSIYIYNLGPDSRARFEKLNSKIVLSAGYRGDETDIFVGTISRTRTRKEGPDYVTHIEAKDGLVAYEGSTINQSFGQPTSVTDAVKTLFESFKSAKIGVPDIGTLGIPSKTYRSGIILSGKSIDLLDQVLRGVGMEVTIYKENLIVIKKGATRGSDAFVLSTDTGMIGIPEVGDSAITVSSLLNNRLEPFKRLIIRSRFVNGIYRMVKIEHVGDTFQGEYVTRIETDRAEARAVKTANGIQVVSDGQTVPVEVP